MFRIGIDVGSTFIKYCVLSDDSIIQLNTERTPVRQREFFEQKIKSLETQYPNAEIVSCGYGKKNVINRKNVNELVALARGAYFLKHKSGLILDIGGQDTKIIEQDNGKLTKFFINDKCAAGCGMFLTSALERLEIDFAAVNLNGVSKPQVQISTVCAVFAQSEIIELIADNVDENEIIQAVIWQILMKAKTLLGKLEKRTLLLSGGLTLIPGIQKYASNAFERECEIVEHSAYLSAIGCVV